MPEVNPEDLAAILREQRDLRMRLSALEARIEKLHEQTEKPPEPAQIPKREVHKPEPAIPPPLPTFPPPPALKKKSSWEFQLGTVWLVRIGIVILLTGLVFLGNYAYRHIVPHLGPWIRLALLYILGGGIAWLGARLEKGAASMRNYGRVLLAGGAALLYYATYGAAFVEKLRVISSPLLGGLFLLGVGALVVRLAEKRQAQSVALTAILLSYYTSAINPLGTFSLYSSLLLTLAGVYFLVRHRWTTVGLFSLIGTYGSYAFWRFSRTAEIPHPFWLGAVFLLGYWVLFTAAVFLSRSTQFTPDKRTPFLTINNGAFFALVFQMLHAHAPNTTGRFSLVFGGILLALAWIAKRRQNEDLFLDGAYLIQGLGVITLGLVTELNGYQLSLALAIQGTVLLFAINRRHGWVYEVGGFAVSLTAFGMTLLHHGMPGHQSITWWTLAALFAADAWLIKNFKKQPAPKLFDWQAAAYSGFAVVELLLLILKFGNNDSKEILFCLTTLILLVVGRIIRLRELAIVGQSLAFLMAAFFVVEGPHSSSALAQGMVIGTPFVLMHWWQRQKETSPWQIGQTLLSALFLAAASRWIDDHSARSHLGFYLASLGLGAMIYGRVTRLSVLPILGQCLVFLAAAVFFANSIVDRVPVSRFQIYLLLLLIANERLLKLGFPQRTFLDAIRRTLIVMATAGLWWEINRWIEASGSHFPKTLAWALLGTAALCFGLLIRERTYRIAGLALLALAIFRIFLSDIWGLDPVFRILSFIVLGVVLLLLGFIYNKFAEKLKDWL